MSIERDLANCLAPQIAIATETVSGAVTGEIVNTDEYHGLCFITSCAAITAKVVLKIEHGTKPDLSDAVEVDPSFLIVGDDGLNIAVDKSNSVHLFGYIGKKQYVRVSIASGAGNLGMVAVLGYPRKKPTLSHVDEWF